MTLANTATTEISVIEALESQAHALRTSVELNLWQLARVLMEARPLVKRGEWADWCDKHAGVSERSAQQMIQAYKRFGEKPQFQGIGKSNMLKMLALPEGTEDAFVEEHPVSEMTAREVDEAVKKIKAEFQEEIENEREERMNAEARAANANAELKALKEQMASQPEIPEEVALELKTGREKLAAAQEEIERIRVMGETALEEHRRISSENSRLLQEVSDKDRLLKKQQADLNQAQQKYLESQSAIAKGDAERVPSDQLTLDVFANAVRTFIGAVARMPHMRVTFGAMDNQTKEDYSVLLETVEKWAKDSRQALETTGAEGTVC